MLSSIVPRQLSSAYSPRAQERSLIAFHLWMQFPRMVVIHLPFRATRHDRDDFNGYF
jgi:hypothetical protein